MVTTFAGRVLRACSVGISTGMNNTTTSNFELGMYYDAESAESAIDRLHDLGYSDADISVMMRDEQQAQAFVKRTGGHAAEGAVTGGAVVGGLAAILAGLTATGSLAAIVGTGGLAAPVVAGPLVAALAGLGAGAAAGGIVGALVGAGIPQGKSRRLWRGAGPRGNLAGRERAPRRSRRSPSNFAD